MDVNVRVMTKEDINGVAPIEAASFSEPWSPDGFESSLNREDTIFLVAEVQDHIVGYVGFYWCFEDADITNVAVDSNYRRCGIGDMLITEMIEICREKRIERIGLEVRESNQSAIRLYEKHGFVNVGVRKNFYRKPTENGIVMNKYIEYEE